jgi:hypothetical protein
VRYVLGRWAGALDDFRSVAAREPSRSDCLIYAFLCRARLGEREAAAADQRAEFDARPGDYYAPVAALLAGDLTVDAFDARVAQTASWGALERDLVAPFFAGCRLLLDGDEAGALARFRTAVASDEWSVHEYQSAEAEIARLGG